MDLTNRAVIITGSLIWIFLVLLVVLLAWGAPDESIDKLTDFSRYLNDHNTTGAKLIVTFGGLILALLGAMLVILEVAPPQTGAVRVTKVGSGNARIGTDEIVRQVEQELRALPQLGDAQVAVVARGHKADIRLDLYVTPDADLASTTDAACRRAREVVEGRMGIQLAAAPQAQLHYRELRVGQTRAPSTGPAVVPPPTRNPYAPPAPVASSASAPPSSEPAHGATENATEDRPTGA